MATTGIIYRLVAHDSASRTFHQVGRAAGTTDSMLGKLAHTAKLAGAALAVGLAAGLAEGARSAAKFQSEMTRISTQAGATAKDVKVLSDQVLKLGTTTQQGPEHLAESLYHLKSVGMDNVSAMKALKEAADLAAVGHADLEETTNALAGAWRTGIKGATSFHEAVSTVNAIIGAGNMTMQQFNAAIGTGILPSAKEFGLSLKQVGAALALMTDEGISADAAATRLRMSFSLMAAPSGAAESQLKKIGLTGLQLADAMRGKDGLIGAIQLLKDHLDASGMSASQQSQILSRAFGGGRSSSGILLMINNLDVLKKKQEQVNNSTGKFDDAVKMQRKTAEAQWKLLTSNLEVMSIRVGTKVLPPITGFVHFLASTAMPAAARFGTAMGRLIPVDKIKQGISDVKKTVGGFLSGLTGGKSAGSIFSDFMDGLSGKKPATGGFKLPKATTPKNLPPSAVAYGMTPQHPTATPKVMGLPPSAVAYGMNRSPNVGSKSTLPPAAIAYGQNINRNLPKVTKPKMSAAQQFGKTIRDAVSGGIEHLDWGKLGSGIGKGLSTAIGWVGKHASDLTKKLGDTLAKIDFVDVGKAVGGQALPFAIGLIVNLFEPLFHVSFWKKHWWDTILAVLSVIPVGKAAGVVEKLVAKIPFLKAFSPILKGIEGLGGSVEKGLGKLLKPVGKFGKSILDGIVKGFTKVFPESAGKLSEFIGKLALNIIGYTGRFIGFGERMIGGLGRGILKAGEKIGEPIGKLIGNILKPFAKVGGWLLRKGADLISGLGRGIAAAAKGFGSWVWRRAGRPVVDAFKGAGSTLLSKGRALIGGLKDGIVSVAKGFAGWTWRTVGKPSVDAFKTVGSWLLGKGKSFVSGLKNGIVGAARGIGSWVKSRVINPAVGVFKGAGVLLRSKGGAFISGLKSGIVGAMKGIGSWIKSRIVDPVVGAVKKFFGIRSPSRVFMSIGGHLVGGLLRGMSKTSGTAIAKKVFGSLPKALAAIAKKGLVSLTSLPGKALKALGSLGGDLLGLLGLGGGGGGGSSANQKIGQTLAAARGWSGPQWAALKNLWNGESGWNERALNKASGAYGIPQSLPASKMASAGSDWKTNPATQIKWGMNYIASRYGNPVSAYAAWLSRSPHWYAKGTGGAAKGLAWVGEKGPELVNFKGGEDVLSNPQSMAFAKANGIKLPGYASGTILNAADRVHRDKQRVEDAKDALANAKRRHKGVAAAEKKLKAAEKELQAAELALKNAKRSAKVSISNTIATGLLKKLETGTSSAIASAIKSLATKLLNAGYTKTAASIQKKGTRLESLADKRASVQKKIAEANQYAADQAGNIRDFLSISGTSATDVGSLISQMTGQQKTASGFVSLTKSLKTRGASKDLLAQLAEAGPGSQLATILGQKNVTTGDIDKLNKLVASGGKLATSFGKDMADMMYDSGKHAGDGFLAGLKATEKDLQKQINKLAKDLVAQIKKALKIKSPSGVFRDEIGKNVVLGMAHGIDLHSHLVGSATQRLADTATGISMRRRYVPAVASRRSSGQDEVWERLAAALEKQAEQPQRLTGQLVLDSGELLGVIEGVVRPNVKASERTQAYRAKVGRRNP